MCFFAIESKMDNLYFSSENNHFDLIIKEFYAFLQEYKINENNYQNYLDLYFQMIDIKRTLKVDLLENLSQFDDELYCKPNDNDKYELKYNLKCGLNDNLKDDLKNIYKRSIISEVLLNIYQTFLKKISPQIVSIMNSNNVMFFENYFDFKTRYDESKFWFVNSKCRYDFIADINDLLDIIFNIKKIIQSVNINTTYLLAKSVDTSKIKSQLKTLAFSFKSDSLLKIIASYGFLDFD